MLLENYVTDSSLQIINETKLRNCDIYVPS